MNKGMQPIRDVDVNKALEGVILPRLAEMLQSREDGHCMRVDDIPAPLMVSLCSRLREAAPGYHVFVLRADGASSVPDELAITATKLIEIRNPDSERHVRRPMLVFVPQEARTAAEDSFAPSTFEQVILADSYDRLKKQILAGMTNGMPGMMVEILRRLDESQWPWVTKGNVTRFLLAIKLNGNTPDTIGPALCEIGLVPDFALTQNPVDAPARIDKNLRVMRALTYSDKSDYARVLSLGLADRQFRKELAGFLATAGLADPLGWTRQITYDRNAWKFSFDKWRFEDEIAIGSVHIEVTDLGVPRIPEDTKDERIQHLVGQPYLPVGKEGLKKFTLTFRVAPNPRTVSSLARFSATIISREDGPIGVTKTRQAGRQEKITITFNRLNQIAWDEGWHYIRVDALTEEGDRLPLVDAEGQPLPWEEDETAHMTHPNYSIPFFVLPEGEIVEQPPQRAVPRFESLTHAILHHRLGGAANHRQDDVAVSEISWEQESRRTAKGGTDQVAATLKRIGKIHVPISRVLKIAEQRILSAPEGALSWRIAILNEIPGDIVAAAEDWPQVPELPAFLDARKAYFDLIRRPPEEMITQGADWRQIHALAIAYAAAYLALLDGAMLRASSGSEQVQKAAMRSLRALLALDTILLTVQNSQGDTREAGLVSPTHPLRALWFAAWTKVGEDWARQLKSAPEEYGPRAREALLEKLVPSSVPPVLTTAHGRQFTAIDNISPCWTLYAPPGDNDPRGLLGLVCTALGLPEPSIGGSLISGRYLAKRVERYIAQHPYVRQLHINAFNPGRGTVLSDMLLSLQGNRDLADLRYDIRLFAPAGRQAYLGAAFDQLLSPTGTVTAREADAFATVSTNPLYPKLRYATVETEAFRASPEQYASHLSFFFDVFPSTEVGAELCDLKEETSPVHGLCQDFHVHYAEDRDSNTASWRRLPRHGAARPIPGAEEVAALMSKLATTLSEATAAVATGEAGPGRRPALSLCLRPDDRALIHQVHEVSDWVFTADRNIGIEFFDHGGARGRPDYLIDHSPDMESSLGHRLVVTSRSLSEIEAMLGPILKLYGLPAERRHAVAILDQLRSLSGRLALKLLSAPTQKAEALGLALSRCYLDMQGAFEDQIVVPLDAHLDLYAEIKHQAEELDDAVSFKRTDLALFDLNARDRTVTCNLVEVKCYQSTGDMSAYTALKERVMSQLTQSGKVIQWHFDPHRTDPDRPDRILKTREFTTILRFYLDRGVRYGLMSPDVTEEARFFLETMEDGYRLLFSRSGVIFDFEKAGVDPIENDAGVEFHRIGADLVAKLVAAAGDLAESRTESASVATLETPSVRTLSSITSPELPRLETAAFLVRRRDHSVPTDQLVRDAIPAPPLPEPQEPETAPAAEPLPAEPVPPKRPAILEIPSAKTLAIAAETAGEYAQYDENGVASPQPPPKPEVLPDVFLGATSPSPQCGLIGESNGRKIALDLNQTHTISLFGVQGGGKSYTLGAIMEMACLRIPQINLLPKPLATVVFHYSPTQDYSPEFTSMSQPNTHADEIAALVDRYSASPMALKDIVLLTPRDKLDVRTSEYPELSVVPLTFAARELDVIHWQFLMGTIGNPSAYVRQMRQVMRKLRNEDQLTLQALRTGIATSGMPDHLKDMAAMRLDFAAQYVTDEHVLNTIVQPGRLIIVDLRDELIEKDEALGLFVVLMQLFSDARYAKEPFNKLVVFDEAHKYIESPDLVSALIQVVREMRHKGTSVLVASQDPPSVPVSLIELSSQIIMHRFNSPAWLKHIQKANAALGSLTSEKMAALGPGQAYIWSSKATDDSFSRQAIKVQCRPRVTQHGGATKTAIDEENHQQNGNQKNGSE